MAKKQIKPKRTRREFKNDCIQKIIDIAAKATACGIQYSGCPCNTCFHNWAENELDLTPDMAHMFWQVILAMRGDSSSQIEILRCNKEFFEDIIKSIK